MPTMLDGARSFVKDASRRGVMSVIPEAVARTLNCSKEDAVKLLLGLIEEELVEIKSYIRCDACGENHPLQSRTFSGIAGEIKKLSGMQCGDCGNAWPTVDQMEVHLSFFCVPADEAGQPDKKDEPLPIPKNTPIESDIYFTGREIIQITQNFNVSAGANVGMGPQHVQGNVGGVSNSTVDGDQNIGGDDNEVWHKNPVIIAAIITGILGVIGTIVAAYFGK